MASVFIYFIQLLFHVYVILPIKFTWALCEFLFDLEITSIENQSMERISVKHNGHLINSNLPVRTQIYVKKTAFPTLPKIVEDDAEYLENSWLGETLERTARAQNAKIIDELKGTLLKYVLSSMNQINSPENLCDLLQQAGTGVTEQFAEDRTSDDQYSTQFHDQLREGLNEFECVLGGMFQSFDKCLQYYKDTMQTSLKKTKTSLSSNELMKLHEEVKRETIAKFQLGLTSNDNEISTEFLYKIQENIDGQLAIFENESSVHSFDMRPTAEEENLSNERLCNEMNGGEIPKETEQSNENSGESANLSQEGPCVEFKTRYLSNNHPTEKLLKICNISKAKQNSKTNKSGVGDILNKAIKIFAASEALNTSIVAGELTGSVEIAKEMLENEFEWSFLNSTRSTENIVEDLASMIQ